jgi:hypothetical protein
MEADGYALGNTVLALLLGIDLSRKPYPDSYEHACQLFVQLGYPTEIARAHLASALALAAQLEQAEGLASEQALAQAKRTMFERAAACCDFIKMCLSAQSAVALPGWQGHKWLVKEGGFLRWPGEADAVKASMLAGMTEEEQRALLLQHL